MTHDADETAPRAARFGDEVGERSPKVEGRYRGGDNFSGKHRDKFCAAIQGCQNYKPVGEINEATRYLNPTMITSAGVRRTLES